MNHNKIIITGDAGRGKTTLAAKLSKKLDIPVHSTDDYYWEVRFYKPMDRQRSIENISSVYHADKWIVEGTTQHLLSPGMESADIIIYLHFRYMFFQWLSILKRSIQRGDGVKKVIELLKHVYRKKNSLYKNKITQQQFVDSYNKKVITLTSFIEIKNFVNIL